MPPIRATGTVPAPPAAVFGYLVDLENHWQLADRFVEVVSLRRRADGVSDGGCVRLRGPLGLRRTVATAVLAEDPPREIVGRAELGDRTCATVRWKLAPRPGGTQVTLEAAVERATPLDRLLLALGGRLWLERRLAAVLDRLHERHASPARRDDGGLVHRVYEKGLQK